MSTIFRAKAAAPSLLDGFLELYLDFPRDASDFYLLALEIAHGHRRRPYEDYSLHHHFAAADPASSYSCYYDAALASLDDTSLAFAYLEKNKVVEEVDTSFPWNMIDSLTGPYPYSYAEMIELRQGIGIVVWETEDKVLACDSNYY
eukprot:CAMPEP_0183754820 /NCGR_PEP_ID=MMETSP0739-20130205/3738_1 /TAXON_ID=385413 /ORGANISM="Thalassiosira miniscula, Strain CCMP1093" /LENGTH=145 /DNA_ID=CAMNT_0025991463 /DNA_START=255 /DNA_END=692 /DNA_ORIENTATION=+